MHVFLIAFNFPPANTPQARRVGALVRALVSESHQVTVVTSSASNEEELWFKDSLAAGLRDADLAREHLRVLVLPSRLGNLAARARENEWAKASRTKRIFRRIFSSGSKILLPDKSVFWSRRAVSLAVRVLNIHPADVVVASSPPVSTLIAAKRISDHFGLPLAIDWRDPAINKKDRPKAFQALRQIFLSRLSRVLNEAADLVTVATAPMLQNVTSMSASVRGVVTNGYEPSEWIQVHASDLGTGFNIVYTGVLYPERLKGLAELFEAMGMMPQKAEVRFHYYGPNGVEVTKVAASSPASVEVLDHGVVPRKDSLAATKAADLLVVLNDMSAAGNHVLTSKLFDCLASGRPIVHLGYRYGAINDLLEGVEQTWTCTDSAQIEVLLNSLLYDDSSTGESNNRLIKTEWTREHQSLRWVRMIESVVQ